MMNDFVEIVLTGSQVPDYATEGAAAWDLAVQKGVEIYPDETVMFPMGFALRMPHNMCAMIASRSGLGSKGLVVKQGVGIIDSDYHREIFVPLHNISENIHLLRAGDRVAQLLFMPVIHPDISVVDSFEDNGRGGFGHTGA